MSKENDITQLRDIVSENEERFVLRGVKIKDEYGKIRKPEVNHAQLDV